jgi:hypothetical protein
MFRRTRLLPSSKTIDQSSGLYYHLVRSPKVALLRVRICKACKEMQKRSGGIGSALQGLGGYISCTVTRACSPNMSIVFATRALSVEWASFGSVTESRNRSLVVIASAAGVKAFRLRGGKGKQNTVDPTAPVAVVCELQLKPQRSTYSCHCGRYPGRISCSACRNFLGCRRFGQC